MLRLQPAGAVVVAGVGGVVAGVVVVAGVGGDVVDVVSEQSTGPLLHVSQGWEGGRNSVCR